MWIPVQKGKLIDIPDEQIEGDLPKNCKISTITQVVIRSRNKSTITYEIDEENFKILSEKPLQCSYFLLHEWLRDMVLDSERINSIVRYLHSYKFLTDSTKEVKNELYKRGFFIDDFSSTNSLFKCLLRPSEEINKMIDLFTEYKILILDSRNKK